MRVLDLFSGCGGMSWGLQCAGFEIIAAIDNDPVPLRTFQYNHPDTMTTCEDLSNIDPEQWLLEIGLNADSIDMIVGGPPCQGFSKNVPRSQRFLDDERNLLVKRFLEFVRVIRPRFVIMENVAEILKAFDGTFTREILGLLRDWGYSADVQILDAANYGIPQHRRRAFFFASTEFVVDFPAPTHFAPQHMRPLFSIDQQHVSVWDAIGDLPPLQHGEGEDPEIYVNPPQTPYQILMRNDAKYLRNHVARRLSPRQFARLSSIQPGEGARELPADLRPKNYYSGAYGRLTKDMVAKTLTRWMFHPGSGRFGHPVDVRTITIREAARLQSFSDDFVFCGSFAQASGQIGNSVPPLLMIAFAQMIHTKLVQSSSVNP